MKHNELLTHYEGSSETSGFNIRTYDSVVDFKHRNMFEHKHSDFEISLILRGEGLYHFKDGICDIHAGDVFVLGSNQIHCITDVYGDGDMALFNIQMESSLFWSSSQNLLNENHLKLFNDRCARFRGDIPIAKKMKERILEIREESISRRAGYKIRMYACLMSLIGELVLECGVEFDSETDVKKASYKHMERAMKYIDEHLSEEFSLEDVALCAGYSKNYFSTLFTQLNGLSLWDYITIKRISISKSLLIEGDMSITEIAARSGYSNLSNFNRHFRRLVGTSPREYAALYKKS